MNRRTFFPLAILLVLLALATGLAQQTAPATKPVSIPFEMVTRHVVVKVTVDKSRPRSFVLDTGAGRGIIDIDRARELGLNLQGGIRVGGAGAQTQTGALVQNARWSLLGMENFSQPVSLAIPLGNIAARFGNDFEGIIGSE